MTLTIHRGTHQIGGCVTELRTKTTRIFIDFGSPLPNPEERLPVEKLDLSGVTALGEPCQGILFTHTHGDHMGEMGRILSDIPLYLGETAREISMTLYRRLAYRGIADSASIFSALERAHTFHPGVPFMLGDIRIVPLLVDHSAFDAYMFLIEADGIRLLHTGDFRNHGPRGKALLPMLRHYVGQVDWLICEGTTLSRHQGLRLTEYELGHQARKLMERYRHVFALCSSTNIDRLATLCHSTPRGRPVVCDFYQKEVLNTVEAHSGEKSSFYSFHRVIPYSKGNEKLRCWMADQGFLMFIRANDSFQALMEPYREDCLVLYSMWEGYLEGACANSRLAKFLEGFPMVRLHTSGHAGVDTLQAVCRAVQPRRGIVPIHSETPEVFSSVVPKFRVVCPEDGDTLTL